jgi:hypothetical protein
MASDSSSGRTLSSRSQRAVPRVQHIFRTGARGATVDEKGCHRWARQAEQGIDDGNTLMGERQSGRSGELLLAEVLLMDLRRRGNGG